MSGKARHTGSAGFEGVRFAHNALPELDIEAIDLTTEFLGHKLRIPYLASSMTGGPERAAAINLAIADAAQHLGFAMAVGSQRIAMVTGSRHGLGHELRRRAPSVPIFANLGAVQLIHGMGSDDARRAVEEIEANALILHLNPLQEALQPEGDREWRGVEKAIADLVRAVSFPIIAKEVGFGISGSVAKRLVNCGVSAIDVAGSGGTSWAAVEGQRQPASHGELLGEMFRDWGLSTTHCLAEVRNALPNIPLIASGGVRNGLDGAKAIRLGACLVGEASSLLAAAVQGSDAVIGHVELWSKALRIACFATGSASLAELRNAPLLAP